ncbi:MAG: hypothetical protein E6J14_12105 [Chloroflexi bacterium]|nr:MAG: hypothetical protein E6J14_12105 [Chloroflexota bacterium]
MPAQSITDLNLQSSLRASAGEWIWCAALLAVPFVVTAAVFVLGGKPRRRGLVGLIDRSASGVERLTGRPAWSSAGVAIGVWALITAAVGFFWDVAWHIDLGRDRDLFTPPHTLIVAGLMGLAAAGAVSTILATAARAESGLRIGSLRIPWGAAGLLVLGTFATLGFPLDGLWHSTYGVDVTMWSPTHLMMISGAAFAPLAAWLLYREGGHATGHPAAQRTARIMLVGALVVALAAFQLEFDDGVPQWQMLYQPVLIALGATAAMTIARVALGRGWALLTAVLFLVIRGLLTLLVGVALHRTVTHFPLYLGIAVCIEAGFLLASRSVLAGALTGGVLAGTAGLASEWGWSHAWSYQPWQPSMFPGIWTAFVAAVAGAVLGAAAGSVLGGVRPRMRGPVLALAGVAALIVLAVPFPRHTAPIVASIDATPVGSPSAAIDRYGRLSLVQDANASVRVVPAEAAEGADVFRVIAWQGGGRVDAPLQQVSPGVWRTTHPVPTGSSWKAIVYLQKQVLLVAAPVAMPSDPDYGQAAIPLAGHRTVSMVAGSSLLMREAHTGTLLPQLLAYGGVSLDMLLWLVVLVAGYVMVGRSGSAQPRKPVAAERRGLTPAGAVR